MKYGVIGLLLLAVSAVRADDYVMIKYTSGSFSGSPVKITITRPIDKSGTLIPSVFARLEAISALEKKSFLVPSAPFITIEAEMDGRRLKSSSCHTLFESNPNLIATSKGVAPLNGETREVALLKEPRDFMEFRRLWEESLSISMKGVTATIMPRQHGAENNSQSIR
jgi:hypothetical protein